MTDEYQKDLFKDIETSNFRLPDIKRIRINDVSDSDTDLSSFLSNCIPNKLKLLCINSKSNTRTPIKSKFDIKSLSKAVGSVTKEVYIRMYEFSVKDLQQFVRAAHSAERIIIQRCSVHCSSALDFGSKLKYNTNFLSFQHWWLPEYKELTTDWMSDPSCFSHIVDAIGRSGLRHSLTKLSIYCNLNLLVKDVQELINAKGMEHISVVTERPDPSFK